MTATGTQTEPTPRAGADRAANFVARAVLTVLGAALTLAAFGLWLVSGSGGLAGLFLMKLGVSLFMLIAGMCLLVIGRGKRR